MQTGSCADSEDVSRFDPGNVRENHLILKEMNGTTGGREKKSKKTKVKRQK